MRIEPFQVVTKVRAVALTSTKMGEVDSTPEGLGLLLIQRAYLATL
ncbi:hypothetical protein OV450_7889 [Actinobacteria bacterium OV450]|nr:hypothetical protein OV450_7889 [Actinobacteria bacterium OV450]